MSESTTVEILYEVQTQSHLFVQLLSTTVEILYEVQTFWEENKIDIYNSRNFIWSSNSTIFWKRRKSTTVEILYEVQTNYG